MYRSQLQLIHSKQKEEKLPAVSLLSKFSRSINKLFNGESYDLIKDEDESHLTKVYYSEAEPENKVIAGLITEIIYPGINILEIGNNSCSIHQNLSKLPVQYSRISASIKDFESGKNKDKEEVICSFYGKNIDINPAVNRFDVVVINNSLVSYRSSYIVQLLKKAVTYLKDENSLLIISLSQQIKSWNVWRKTKHFPLPYADVSVRNNSTGITYDIKAFRGF